MADKPESARKNSKAYIVSVGSDVCWTPMGSEMVPVAYNSFVNLDKCIRTSKNVYHNGDEAFTLNSRAVGVMGHEQGTGGGVIVPGYRQYGCARKGSSTVFIEGWPAVKDGDPAWINLDKPGSDEPRGEIEIITITYGFDGEAQFEERQPHPDPHGESKAIGNAAARIHIIDESPASQQETKSHSGDIWKEAKKRGEAAWDYLISPGGKEDVNNASDRQNEAVSSAPSASSPAAEPEENHPHIDPNAYYRSYWEGPAEGGKMVMQALAEPHVQGGLNGVLDTAEAVGGLIMAGVGAMTAETIVGSGAAVAGTVIAANGYDKAAADFRQMVSGKPQETGMQQAARDTSALFGADEEQQEKAAAAMGFAQDALPLLIGNPKALGVLGKAAPLAREGEGEAAAALKKAAEAKAAKEARDEFSGEAQLRKTKAKIAEARKSGDGITVYGEKRAAREGTAGKPKEAAANKVQYHGKTAQGNLEHFSGTKTPKRTGMTPNSLYSRIIPQTGKVKQNAIYDSDGNLIGHVDFENHGKAASGHYHTFPPGHPEIGHDTGALHYPYSRVPSGWDTLPPGLEPKIPITK